MLRRAARPLYLWALLGLALPAPAVAADVSMPLRFDINAEPREVLRQYPLGEIDEQTAFSHHGQADKKVELPNGAEGWLYDVGREEWHRTYTLVFGGEGTVIDVLYYDHSRFEEGLSALVLQSVALRTEEPALGPGPRTE